jgi:hypothetical protein
MRCVNQISGDREHFWKPFPMQYHLYIEYIKTIVEVESIRLVQTCSVVNSVRRRTKFCGKWLQTVLEPAKNCLGIDHVRGQGLLIKQKEPCSVRFDFIQPRNPNDSQYILWVSTGEHNHPPPPVHRVPEAIRNNIVRLFTRLHDASLTLSK